MNDSVEPGNGQMRLLAKGAYSLEANIRNVQDHRVHWLAAKRQMFSAPTGGCAWPIRRECAAADAGQNAGPALRCPGAALTQRTVPGWGGSGMALWGHRTVLVVLLIADGRDCQ